MKIHPNESTLEDFLLCLDGGRREILHHLVWCSTCRSRLLYLPRQPRFVDETAARPPKPDYEGVLDESRRAAGEWACTLARERDEAPGLFVELLEQPVGKREALLAQTRRLQTWGVFELLVERSLEAASRDPALGEELGLLALELAKHLDAGRYGAAAVEDLRARAWSHVGNARRIRFDFAGAEKAFSKAAVHLKEGSRDLLEAALRLDLEASLRRDQRRFADAFRLLRRAVRLFLHLQDRHRAGRSLVNTATVHHHNGHPEEGIPLLLQALGLIDSEQEPRLLRGGTGRGFPPPRPAQPGAGVHGRGELETTARRTQRISIVWGQRLVDGGGFPVSREKALRTRI